MISLLCPTRKRPKGVERMWNSAKETADNPDEVELVLRIDLDDASKHETMRLAEAAGRHLLTHMDLRTTLSKNWNEAAKIAHGEILMQCADDIVFRSQGWDTLVKEAFDRVEDKILLVYGRDGLNDAALGTHSWVHRRWIETLGYFVPPYFSCDYADTWINQIAETVGRRHFIKEIFTEHMHPAAGKAELDKTHRERLARGAADKVEELYTSRAMGRKRLGDAKKLKAAMTTTAQYVEWD